MSMTLTATPDSANARASVEQRKPAPPITTATLPFKLNRSSIVLCAGIQHLQQRLKVGNKCLESGGQRFVGNDHERAVRFARRVAVLARVAKEQHLLRLKLVTRLVSADPLGLVH